MMKDKKLNAASKKKRLLIVDDEENMRHMLTSMLTKFIITEDSGMIGF